jgi:hypothetical protein
VVWKRKIHRRVPKHHDGKIKNFSIQKKLRKERKTTEEFEIMLASLSLEDIIALKLELATKAANGYMYGVPVWQSMPYVIKEALLKFAMSATRSRKEAARFLGIDIISLNKLANKYKIRSFFEEE